MILTCPDCATRYSTNPEAIGPNGRTVRCSSCSATWFVSAEPDIMELNEQQAEMLAPVIREVPGSEDLTREDQSQDEGVSFGRKTPELGAHVTIRDQTDQRRRNRRLLGISMIWLITLGLLTAAALIAFFFRQPIVEKAPAAASIYRAFGITVKEKGLDFENPKTRNIIVNNQPTLVVNGHIRNHAPEARAVPMIELSLVTLEGDVLARWAVEPPQAKIPAGERMEYVSEYPNPPVEAATLKYRFLDEGEELPVVEIDSGDESTGETGTSETPEDDG